MSWISQRIIYKYFYRFMNNMTIALKLMMLAITVVNIKTIITSIYLLNQIIDSIVLIIIFHKLFICNFCILFWLNLHNFQLFGSSVYMFLIYTFINKYKLIHTIYIMFQFWMFYSNWILISRLYIIRSHFLIPS